MNDPRTRLLVESKQIIERAKSVGRSMTDDERSTVKANIEAAKQLATKADADDQDELRRRLAHKLRENPLPGQLGRFSAKTAATAIATKINDGKFGSKALAPSGSEVAPADLSELTPISLSKPATTLLAVVGAKVVEQPPNFAYLKQTTRTNSAATVADGATRPTSVYGLTRVEDRLRVVAHLSEPVPKYWLDDAAELRVFIEQDLAYGLDLAVEAQLINGPGTGENARGILQTSGIQTQAWSTDRVGARRWEGSVWARFRSQSPAPGRWRPHASRTASPQVRGQFRLSIAVGRKRSQLRSRSCTPSR